MSSVYQGGKFHGKIHFKRKKSRLITTVLTKFLDIWLDQYRAVASILQVKPRSLLLAVLTRLSGSVPRAVASDCRQGAARYCSRY